MKHYLFTSSRLGFRPWMDADIAPMAAINADPEVMEFFPAVQTHQQTVTFISRMNRQLEMKGFTYFAVDRLDTGSFIGFIGLSVPAFEADFMPCVDMGWRLSREAWGNGFATEGALRCLEFAFKELQLAELVAIAPKANIRSESVMKKIGMKKVREFQHPLLKGDPRLATCVLYQLRSGNALEPQP